VPFFVVDWPVEDRKEKEINKKKKKKKTAPPCPLLQ
jgi:hypothetical protein